MIGGIILLIASLGSGLIIHWVGYESNNPYVIGWWRYAWDRLIIIMIPFIILIAWWEATYGHFNGNYLFSGFINLWEYACIVLGLVLFELLMDKGYLKQVMISQKTTL